MNDISRPTPQLIPPHQNENCDSAKSAHSRTRSAWFPTGNTCIVITRARDSGNRRAEYPAEMMPRVGGTAWLLYYCLRMMNVFVTNDKYYKCSRNLLPTRDHLRNAQPWDIAYFVIYGDEVGGWSTGMRGAILLQSITVMPILLHRMSKCLLSIGVDLKIWHND